MKQDLAQLLGISSPITLPQLKEYGFLTSTTSSSFNYDFSHFSFSTFFDTYNSTSGSWYNAATGKTFNPYDFLPAIQVAFGFAPQLSSIDLDFSLADMFIPNFGLSPSTTIFKKINATLPGPVNLCDLVGCDGVRGLSLGKRLLKLLNQLGPITITGGTLGGGQVGTGSVDMDRLLDLLRTYLGVPSLTWKYV